MNQAFNCKICENETYIQDKLVYCGDCNIYWGDTAETIENTLGQSQLKNLFTNKSLFDDSYRLEKQESFLNRMLIQLFILAVLMVFV
jgi:hypothetical protein